jgi:hypothetical protein
VDRIVEHWWSGSWAELFRRDIWLRTDGTTWTVEARQGNRHGVWSKTFDDEETARILVEAMKARSGDTWRDISPTDRPRDEGKTA